MQVLGENGRFITLIKPQFEAGRDRVGKKGVVSDPKVHEDVIRSIVEFVPTLGWHTRAIDFSPITGPEGNIEFLADLQPGEGEIPSDELIAKVVAEAHKAHKK
jgi:23S rRNA (cytidine1920-2'-O)/16S rRNA (cytidine1409-2'-O)-methyltransferase